MDFSSIQLYISSKETAWQIAGDLSVSDFVEIARFMLLSVELVASVIRPTNPAGYPAW